MIIKLFSSVNIKKRLEFFFTVCCSISYMSCVLFRKSESETKRDILLYSFWFHDGAPCFMHESFGMPSGKPWIHRISVSMLIAF